MSTRLGTLTLDLIARIGNFTGPIREAERQAESSFSKMRKHVNTYGLAVAGAAAGAVTALAAMAIETSNQAAELEIFAFRANTTTQEFQKMAVGAAAFGVEGDKLSDMMKDFNEKLGELTAIGAGGGVDFFEKIAMKTEGSSEAAKQLILDMQKLSGPDALQLYVDKLEEAGVTQQQMSFYLESMASDLTDLYPLLANGGEGFKLYGDMAARAGLIMTDQTREAALALKDQVYMLDLQLQGVKNQLMQAVIPAFVDIAEAFLGGSEQGLQFTGIAEGVAKTLKWVAAAAIGAVTYIQLVGKALGGMAAIGGAVLSNKDWYEMGPLGYAKAAYDARDEISALTSEIKTDMHETIMSAAERLDKMWEGGASKKAEQLRGIRELSQGIGDTNGGLSELADKQNEAAKATKDATKALKEQQAQARNSISHAYADREKQIQMELNEELKAIRKANFPDPNEYLEAASRKAYLEKQIYLSQLQYEINEFKLTEEQKLKYKTEIDQLLIQADIKLTEENRKIKLQALDEQYAIELQKSRFHAQNMRQTMQESISGLAGNADDIFARATMSPADYDRWSLENDRSNAQVDLKKERVKVEQDIKTAPADVYADADARYQALLDSHKEYRDGLAAIDVDYHQKAKELDAQQELDQLNLWSGVLGQAQNTFAQLTQSAKNSAGEQSSVYKTMFAMQQAFSVASSLTAAWTAYAQAFADPSAMTLPQKIAGGATVLAALMPAVTTISSIGIDGMAHDGMDNIPKEGTWLLDKGERVVDSRTNADLKNMIANGGNGGPQININVPPGYTAEQSRGADGAVTIDIVEKKIKQSWGNLSNSNSFESKQVQRNTTAGVKR